MDGDKMLSELGFYKYAGITPSSLAKVVPQTFAKKMRNLNRADEMLKLRTSDRFKGLSENSILNKQKKGNTWHSVGFSGGLSGTQHPPTKGEFLRNKINAAKNTYEQSGKIRQTRSDFQSEMQRIRGI